MYLFTEVIFYSGKRKDLPMNGCRPDAIFNGTKDYWGITFVELLADPLFSYAGNSAHNQQHM